MNSCPKCGSVSVTVGKKQGKCFNPQCLRVGPAHTFQGLSGPTKRPKPSEFIGGGAIRRPPLIKERNE